MRKANKSPPATFLERLYALEHERHARRLAEIKRLEVRIRMLEPIAAALAERGIHLSRDNCLDGFNGVLMLSSGALSCSEIRLYDALIELGFVELQRDSGTTFARVMLKKSRLKISLLIPAGHAAAKEAH